MEGVSPADVARGRRDRFPWVVLLFFLSLTAALVAGDRLRPGGRELIKISGVDEVAYYSMCHSLLFDRDMDLTNEYDRLRVDRNLGQKYFAVVPETGRPRSVFPIGFSILEMPFLVAGNALDLLTGGAGDGYSRSCVGAFFIGVLFYLCLGLLLTQRLLLAISSGEANAGERAVLAGVIAFLLWPSTTLLYYSFMLLAQTASFMATALFLLMYLRARRSAVAWRWAAAGAAAGLMALCRWQDLLFVATAVVDELLSRSHEFRPEEGWAAWARCRAVATVAALGAFLPQLLAWKSLFGRYVTIPQGVDFFAFPPPHLGRVLASSQNGWFTWTPVAVIGVVGLLAGGRRRPGLAASLVAPIVLQWLLIGSLRDSWHGHLFGMRMLTSCAPLLGVGLLWLLLDGSRTRRAVVLALTTACGAYTFLFAVQYRLDLVPREDRLTAEELVWDKIRFLRALRRRAAERAIEARLEGDPAGSAKAADEAILAFGPDRRLLELLAEARGRSGDRDGQRAAEERLKEQLAARLF